MPEEYRSDLVAAQARIAKLEEQLARALNPPAPELARLEEEQRKIEAFLGKPKWIQWLMVGAGAVAWLLYLPRVFDFDRSHASVFFQVFALTMLLSTIMWTFATRAEKRRHAELARMLIEQVRRRHALEDGSDAARVRVGAEASPDVVEDATSPDEAARPERSAAEAKRVEPFG